MPFRVALLCAFILALAASPCAHAGTVSLQRTDSDEGGTQQTTYELRWAGEPGETNTATVRWVTGVLHLTDATAPVNPGQGCQAAGPNEATCAAPDSCNAGRNVGCSFLFDLNLDGGDGDDVLSSGALPALGSRSIASEAVTLELAGGDGDDTLTGSAEEDILFGGGGRDTIRGGAGSDVLIGDGIPGAPGEESPPDATPGTDVLDGGADADTVSYVNRAEPVAVDLVAGVGGEAGEGDQLSGIENIDGGTGSDVLTGDAQPNDITGGAGDDRIDGGARNDTLTGGVGADTLRGGAGDDMLSGDGAREDVTPLPPASSDVIDGGDGSDTASWAGRSEPIRVDLSDSDPDGEPAAPDTLTSIENVEGSSAKDVLIGDNGPNILDGGGAADSLIGKGGADQLRTLVAGAAVDGGPGNDLIRAGGDHLKCGPGLDRVSVINLKVPGPDCEILAFLSSAWDPIRHEQQTPLIEMKNATPRATQTAISLRLRCPRKACRGVLRLGSGVRGVGEGTLKLRLRGKSFRQVRLPLSKAGKRRIARKRTRTVKLTFGGETAPVVVKLRS